jgi:DMSO/TMAO reductase YedYZ heme-binding membrane subunit
VFLVIHILTTVLDSYVSTGLISAIIPMTSSYKRVAIAVGAVGFDLILAVWISSLLKLHIKNRSWRFIHWFSWMAFATALVHAYLSGTDARHGIGLAVIIACAFTVVLAALWRFFGRPTRAAGRTALSPLARAKNPVPVAPSARAFPSAPRPTTRRGR